MIPPKSHKPEQSETPKFLQVETYFQMNFFLKQIQNNKNI